MSNPLLDPQKFGPTTATSPPTAWPGQPGAPVPPAPDNVPGSPWPPPPPRPTGGDTLRRSGVATATGVLIAIVAVVGIVGWNLVETTTTQVITAEGRIVEQTSVSIPPWIFLAILVGFGLVIATFFKPQWAKVTAPLYAVAQGLLVGAVSKAYEAQFDGIVLQAVGLTVGVFVLMLVLYATGRIRVTPRFRLGLIAATGAVCLIYLATWVMHLFGGTMPFIHEAGVVGIGFSVVVVVIAALNLTLDFDFVDRAERAGAPRELEWFAALGLLVTLVWLYLEILRLLAKLNRR